MTTKGGHVEINIDDLTLGQVRDIAKLAGSPCKAKRAAEPVRYVLIRSHLAGVFVGVLLSRSRDSANMRDSRRVWYWKGRLAVDTLARMGPGDGSRLTGPVDQVIGGTILQVIDVPKSAEAHFRAWPVSEAGA